MNLNILPHTSEAMALAYKAAEDEYPTIPEEQLRSFKQLVNAQFAYISNKLTIEFVDYEPYGQNPKIADMLKDFYAGKLLIHTTGNDSKVWGTFTNLQFRAVHDYIHCMFQLDFTHKDEINAFKKQCEFSFKYGEQFPWLNWETYVGILRSEIVYQSAYKEHFGEFHIDQKIILKEL
jgi:hypothetical protein